MRLDPWPFIVAAYALTMFGTVGVTLWSYLSMRRAEKDADGLSKRP